MKKIFVLLLLEFLAIGCSVRLEIHDSISEDDQAVYHPLPIAKYKDGYYIQNLNNTLYYIEKNQKTLINYCYFQDDQFSKGNHGTYKRYESFIEAGMGFYVLDDAIYTLATYRNVEGETWYSFVQMSLDGKELKELFKLDFQPYNNFTIYNNKVYMIENTAHMTMHIFSLFVKELKAIKGTLEYYIHHYPQKRLNGKTCGQVRKESLKQNEFIQYPIVPAARYVRYWNEIESKKKRQKENIIEEIKNNPNQIEMGC